MAKFVIQIEHEEDECLKALDDMVEKKTLDKFVFACNSGEHIAFGWVEAESEDEALKIVPESLIDKAIIFEVQGLTPEQVKELHEEED